MKRPSVVRGSSTAPVALVRRPKPPAAVRGSSAPAVALVRRPKPPAAVRGSSAPAVALVRRLKPPAAVRGSSTLLITLVLLLLSGACLALLMATQTRMLVAAQQKVQVRLLAAAEGGVELGVARGIAGAGDPTARTLGGAAPGAEVEVEVSGFVPVASGGCRLCMTNLDGALNSLGGLKRVSHVVSATASAPSRSDGLPPPRRSVTAVVELAPWPAASRDRWDAATMAEARRLIRASALVHAGSHDGETPIALATVEDPAGGAPRTVAVGGAGRALHAVEVAPRPGPLWAFVDASDEDGNEAPDFGPLPSAAAIVRLRAGNDARPVALFGGGRDPARPGEVGDWIYAVGLDSGAVLYKRQIDAPVVARPAAVDLSGDGTADLIYAGTVAGSLYRVDVSTAAPLAGGRVAAAAWRPRRVFETGGLPIRHAPAVVPAPALDAVALALGAGGAPGSAQPPGGAAAGRFFVLVDRGAGRLPAAAAIPAVDPSGNAPGPDRLAPGLPPSEQGWSLALAQGEEVASPPLVLGGLLVFLTHAPAGAGGGDVRRYALDLRTGDALGGGARSAVVASAASPLPVDLGAPSRIEVDHPGSHSAPLLMPDEERAVEALRAVMPERCRSDGARLRLAGVGPDGAPLRLAVLPVCRSEVDWFENGMF